MLCAIANTSRVRWVLRNFVRVCASLLERTSAWMFAGATADGRFFCAHFLVHSLTRHPHACCMWHVVWSLCVCKASCSLHVALRFCVELTYGWARQILPQSPAHTRRALAFHSGPSFASVCSQASEESCEKRRRCQWRLTGWLLRYCFAHTAYQQLSLGTMSTRIFISPLSSTICCRLLHILKMSPDVYVRSMSSV